MDDFNYENPTHDEDDYDEDDQEAMNVDDEFEETIQNQGTHIAETPQVDMRTQLKVEQIQSLVKKYYELIKEKYGLDPDHIDYTNFELGSDGITLYLKVGDEEVPITNKRGNSFIGLSTLAGKIGAGGTRAIRDLLHLPDYKSLTKTLSAQAAAALRKVENNLPNIDNVEMTVLPNTVDTIMKEIEELFPEQYETGTQTDIKKREMDAILKAMTTVKEEVANELAKLSETNKHLERENAKLEEAKANNDEFQIERISDRIRELESERSGRLEVINTNRDKLRSQVNRIKDTIHKILKEDTTLGEKIKTLFREQGITIVSVLTAFGMIIGVIVETFIPTTGGTTPPPKPPGTTDVRDWIKKQLSNLGKLLANLAGKAAAALPGIIGAIVSWLLSTMGKVVGWFGEHLWALVVLVGGLLYAAAREYMH